MRRAPAYPDFLGIGAQKAGSCWLNRSLKTHPQIWTPKLKELHYFDQKRDLGRRRLRESLRAKGPAHTRWRKQARQRVRSYRRRFSFENVRWDIRFFLPGRLDDAWYASLFKQAGTAVKGETTPDYSALPPEKVAHVHHLMPEAKILFMMRHPIERAWSQAMMFSRRTGTTGDALVAHVARDHTRLRTDYLRTLEIWSEFYPAEQIFAGFVEDIHFHPEELLRRLYGFLGVDQSFVPPHARERVNEGSTRTLPRDALLRLADLYGGLIDGLDESFGGWAAWWRYSRDRLVADDAGEAVYPFFQTGLFEDWLAREGWSSPPALQSGPLSGLSARTGATAR